MGFSRQCTMLDLPVYMETTMYVLLYKDIVYIDHDRCTKRDDHGGGLVYMYLHSRQSTECNIYVFT